MREIYIYIRRFMAKNDIGGLCTELMNRLHVSPIPVINMVYILYWECVPYPFKNQFVGEFERRVTPVIPKYIFYSFEYTHQACIFVQYWHLISNIYRKVWFQHSTKVTLSKTFS